MPCRVSHLGAQPLDERSKLGVVLCVTVLILSKGKGKGYPPTEAAPLLANIYSRESTCQSKAARTFTMAARFLISPNSLGATTDLHRHTTRAARSQDTENI
jgi:hypothetical protein